MIQFEALSKGNWPWVKANTNLALSELTRGIVATDATGEYVACAIFENWLPNSVTMHLRIDNPMVLRRGFFEEIAKYVFDDCGKGVLLALYSAENREAINLGLRSGFTEVSRIPDAWREGIDMVVHKMTKGDCTHLRGLH